jgi:hypothetical protein
VDVVWADTTAFVGRLEATLQRNEVVRSHQPAHTVSAGHSTPGSTTQVFALRVCHTVSDASCSTISRLVAAEVLARWGEAVHVQEFSPEAERTGTPVGRGSGDGCRDGAHTSE